MTKLADPAQISPAQLATFLAVAEAGGVLAAGRRIHLSQPAVTGRIRQLEETLGVQLFLRSARGMELTQAGRRLRLHAQRIRSLLEDAFQDVTGTGTIDALVIAASTTIAAHVLPPLLSGFQRRHPVPRIEVTVGNTEEVVARVRDGLAPLGLVEGKTKAPAVRLAPLLVDEILPVYAPRADNPDLLGRARGLRSVSDLARVPILWREAGSGTRTVVEEALAKAGLEPGDLPIRFVLGETQAIKQAVLAGLGIAFFSRCSIERELAQGDLCAIPLGGFRIRRTFSWALPGGGLSGAAAAFHAYAARELARPAAAAG